MNGVYRFSDPNTGESRLARITFLHVTFFHHRIDESMKGKITFTAVPINNPFERLSYVNTFYPVLPKRPIRIIVMGLTDESRSPYPVYEGHIWDEHAEPWGTPQYASYPMRSIIE